MQNSGVQGSVVSVRGVGRGGGIAVTQEAQGTGDAVHLIAQAGVLAHRADTERRAAECLLRSTKMAKSACKCFVFPRKIEEPV